MTFSVYQTYVERSFELDRYKMSGLSHSDLSSSSDDEAKRKLCVVIWNSFSPEFRQAKSLNNLFAMVVAISSTESIKHTRHLCKAEFL